MILRGLFVPFLLLNIMGNIITKEKIEKLVLEFIENTDMFLVDISVSSSNNIQIFIDANLGIDINACAALSRFVDNSFDRDEEDFEITVASAGLSEPFKVYKQYVKNIGRQVAITTTDNKTYTGTLKEVNSEGVLVSYEDVVKLGPKGKKKKVESEINLSFLNIKKTMCVITLKK